MRISVLIPTFKRPEYLAKTLRGLAAQERPADQVVLGIREGDLATAEFLAAQDFPVTAASTHQSGVIASMTAAAAQADGEIICFLDDDAEPLPNWLAEVEAHFRDKPKLGLLGGRDLLQDHPEMRKNESLLSVVGRFTWYGRILGNHHRGGGTYREVDLVKGCNAAIRGYLLREIGFAKGLRGKGAQVHWELALSLEVRKRGYTVGYDPTLQVIHHIAPRHDDDQNHRGRFSAEGLYDMVWNEHHVVQTCGSFWQRQSHTPWSLLVGSQTAPGLLQYGRLCVSRDPHRTAKWRTTRKAIWERRNEIS